MKATLLSRAFLAIALSGTSVATAGEWIHLSTPQFELYSTNSEAQSRELMDLLASAHSFLSTLSFVQGRMPQGANSDSVRVVALSSKQEYAPYRLSSSAFGYFRHSRHRNYIVLQDIRPEHRQAAVHECVHVVLRQAGLALPLWLNEGLADLYSSMQAEGGQTKVGESLPSRMRWLETQSPINLAVLFAVDNKSPFYKDPEMVPLFYAESWALVHMLAMSPNYKADFPRFITALAQGLNSGAALSQVYGKTMAEVQDALSAYLPGLSHFPGIMKTNTLILPVAPAFFSHEEVQSEALRELLTVQP